MGTPTGRPLLVELQGHAQSSDATQSLVVEPTGLLVISGVASGDSVAELSFGTWSLMVPLVQNMGPLQTYQALAQTLPPGFLMRVVHEEGGILQVVLLRRGGDAPHLQVVRDGAAAAAPSVAPAVAPAVAPLAPPAVAPAEAPVVTPVVSYAVTPSGAPVFTPQGTPVVQSVAPPTVSGMARPPAPPQRLGVVASCDDPGLRVHVDPAGTVRLSGAALSAGISPSVLRLSLDARLVEVELQRGMRPAEVLEVLKEELPRRLPPGCQLHVLQQESEPDADVLFDVLKPPHLARRREIGE